jgi:sugar lactone lactonase YvrE
MRTQFLCLVVGVLALAGCGGGGGAAADPNWYYHFRCNGDAACLSTNFAGASQGTSDQGPGQGGQSGCNSLMTFGNINWNIPPAEQWCDHSPTIAPPAAPTVNLSVAPATIEAGQSATVTWSSSGATSCTASNAWSGNKALSGSASVSPAGGNHTYTLACTGAGGTTTRSTTLTVNAPAIAISVSPATITDGESATLTWSSTRTASCSASGPWTGATALSGNKLVAPSTGSYTYTLTCLGTGGGSVTNAATLTVSPAATLQPAPTVTISVSPGSVASNEPATLTWESTHATSCTADGSWVGDTPLSGTMTVSQFSPGTYSYVLSCNGSGGAASAAAALNVASSGQVLCGPPSVAISVAPTSIVEGQAATLTWSAAKIASCSSPVLNCSATGAWNHDPVAASGSLGLSPSAGSFTYTLTCSGRNATVSQSATLVVSAGSAPATTVDVTLTPAAINLGESSVLAWTTSGARSCTASGNWSGAVGLDGSMTVTPTAVGAYDYVLTCLGGSGSVADTGTLSVQPVPVSGSAARFYTPYRVAVDSADNVFVSDVTNHVIRKITPANMVTTVAGLSGSVGSADGIGAAARFNYPYGLAIDATDQLYVADSLNRTIRAISTGAEVTTVAGAVGMPGTDDGTGPLARFVFAVGMATDGAGNVYIADSDRHTIRKMTPEGVVTTIAGLAGVSGSTDATGSAARFYIPKDVAIDGAGNLYVADTGNHTIRKIDANGAVTTLAGLAGSSGNTPGTGSAARFAGPSGLACDSAGNIFVSDNDSSLIRKVTPAGVVTTFAGNSPGSADGTGTAASFRLPAGIGVDSADNLYVADSINCTIRKITPGAVVTTLAGQALQCGSN